MIEQLTLEYLQALAEPFPVECIEWKPGATNKDKSRALALAYVDSRYYQDRLNTVLGPAWGDSYQVQVMGQKVAVVATLTLAGVTRSDVGEENASDPNALTTAKAQAFKRACVAFGLGAHLYRLPRNWVAYDGQRKRFTDAALAELRHSLPGQQQAPSGLAYGNGVPLNGNPAERQAYRRYLDEVGKPPKDVESLRSWYAALAES